jgi:hypothetical protein
MAITRLGVANPAANAATVLYSASYATLASVIVSNKSASTSVLPEVAIYVVPAGTSNVSQYGYIVANLEIQAGQSFETFKFAVNPSDVVYVLSTTVDTSFSLNGIIQGDDYGAGDYPLTFTNKIINGNFNTITVEKNNTATRPVNAPIGYVRFNTELNKLEVKNNAGNWDVLGTGFGETGATGPTGPSGGPTGPAGPTGATGSIASINLADLNTLVIDADLASIAGAETLTNKTLNSPTLSGTTTLGLGGKITQTSASHVIIDGVRLPAGFHIEFEGATNDGFETTLTVIDPTADRTVSIPDATTTLVGTDTTDTLTNKTLTAPAINVAINAQTGTTYTPVLADNGKLITLNNASAITVSIPTNASVAYAIGAELKFAWITGAGQPTIQAVTSGTTTILSTGSTSTAPKLRVANSSCSAVKIATDIWLVTGDIS